MLRRIGRGHAGARDLDRDESSRVFGAMLDGDIDDLVLGGLLVAFRMKGESLDEIDGALQALQARVRPIAIDPRRPVVSIPSYNGARHSANLTPLLAFLLADAGIQVIIHGVRRDPRRVTSCQIIQAMGMAPAGTVAEASFSLELGNPAFVPIDVLCPPFAALLSLRERLGVRHLGHTLAKLIDPTDGAEHGVDHCVRLAAFTHPAFDRLQHALLERCGARAVVMRGAEGEVVASVRRMARIDWIERGVTSTLIEADLQPMAERVVLPPADDPVATAAWIQSALAGEQPVPANVAMQVDLILGAIRGTVPAR